MWNHARVYIMLSRMIPKLSLITNHVRFCSTRYLYIAPFVIGNGRRAASKRNFSKVQRVRVRPAIFECRNRTSTMAAFVVAIHDTRGPFSLSNSRDSQARASPPLRTHPLRVQYSSPICKQWPRALPNLKRFAVLALPLFLAEAKRITHTVKGEKKYLNVNYSPRLQRFRSVNVQNCVKKSSLRRMREGGGGSNFIRAQTR